MNIFEIELGKQLRQMSQHSVGHQLADLLKSYGWKVLGRGSEAAVAEHPREPYVLKIWPAYSGYTKFVSMVQTSPNPHFPKFSRVQSRIPGTGFNYVRMEKLLPVAQYDLLVDMQDCFCVLKNILEKTGDPVPDWIQTNQDHIQCAPMTPQAREVVSTIVKLRRKIGANKLDLWPRNIMRRGNVWVITDPVL